MAVKRTLVMALLAANVEEGVELDFDYLVQRDAFRDLQKELAESMVEARALSGARNVL